MDHLVYGISTINFERNLENTANENCSPNLILIGGKSTANLDSITMADDFHKPVNSDSFDTAELPKDDKSWTDSSGGTLNDESEFDMDNEVSDSDPCCSSSSTRRLPSRSCKDKESKMLHKTKRRSIMKPKRLVSVTGELRPAEFRKIYLNKKIGNFHPSKLETIFEEPLPAENADDNEIHIGTRKVKRSLSCCDGLNINKTLIKQRRLKIKKTFGKRFALKKILLEDFMQRLNQSREDYPIAVEEEMTKEKLLPPTTDEGIPLESYSSSDDGSPSKTTASEYTIQDIIQCIY